MLPALSADGRVLVFWSYASNLVPGDGNRAADVFCRDLMTGAFEAISVNPAGRTGNGESQSCSISADGRFVAFYSRATDLVPGDANGTGDVFVRDRQTGTTRLVSKSSSGVQGDYGSFEQAISADGRFVAFRSAATNLVPNDSNRNDDIFVHDLLAGTTERVNLSTLGAEANRDSIDVAISADGRFVAFSSIANNLHPSVRVLQWHVYVHDRLSAVTECVSLASDGSDNDGHSRWPAMSADGRWVCFQSEASRLVPGDRNGASDGFLHDRRSGSNARVNLTGSGMESSGPVGRCTVTPDGRFVAFESAAADLVTGDLNGDNDVFLKDLLTGTVSLVSVGLGGSAGARASFSPSVSSDGRRIAFQSAARDLISHDTNKSYDIFVRDRGTGSTALHDTIVLAGDVHLAEGGSAGLSWYSAPSRARWWLLASAGNLGTTIGGHPFGVGPDFRIMATGTCDARGTAGFTTAPFPAWTAGRTVYVEVGARDAGGRIYDSNVLERIVQ